LGAFPNKYFSLLTYRFFDKDGIYDNFEDTTEVSGEETVFALTTDKEPSIKLFSKIAKEG
jgi:hypothetical protein